MESIQSLSCMLSAFGFSATHCNEQLFAVACSLVMLLYSPAAALAWLRFCHDCGWHEYRHDSGVSILLSCDSPTLLRICVVIVFFMHLFTHACVSLHQPNQIRP